MRALLLLVRWHLPPHPLALARNRAL
jgi:hypothetical protein